MEVLLGFFGAVLAGVLFFSGVWVGCRLKDREFERRQIVTAEQLSEIQKRRVLEEQEAWRHLHNYSVEDAYEIGLRPDTTNKE